MTNKKSTGSYYTPKILSDFLLNHITHKYLSHGDLSILEPSCGDGQFVSSLFKALNPDEENRCSVDLLDIDKKELAKAKSIIPKNDFITKGSYHQDYLKFFLDNDNKYSLIIGNPPYIRKKNMKEEQITRCEQIHERIKLHSHEVKSNFTIKNIWPAFVEASIMSLNNSGVLCFVIPAEILQVNYTRELRSLISSEFDRVEIFAFSELIFDRIQQDVIALVGVKGVKNKDEHGFSFYQVDCLSDLKEPKFTEKYSNIHRATLDKWTNYILSDDELNFVEEIKNCYQPIKHYCKKAEVGIVTAANDYFIINNDKLKANNLNRLRSLSKPIISKGGFVSNLAHFTGEDFDALKNSNQNVNFLDFPDIPQVKLGKIINTYLRVGEDKKLHERYKMLRRKHWYHVPSLWASEGLFIKRSHLFPKMLVNEAGVLATDSFYRMETKDDYSIKKVVFSFYNSMTFVLAELEGRYYGGGVLELTPNEFKHLFIPYHNAITDEQFNRLDEMLRAKLDIEIILAYTNSILFDQIDIVRLEKIRKRLVNRRLKFNKVE